MTDPRLVGLLVGLLILLAFLGLAMIVRAI